MRSQSEPQVQTAGGAHAAFEIYRDSKPFEHTQIIRSQSEPQVYTASGAHAVFEILRAAKIFQQELQSRQFVRRTTCQRQPRGRMIC